jgi:hypothetical protein
MDPSQGRCTGPTDDHALPLRINFRYVIFRAIAGLPAAMDAVSLTEAIFYELRPGDVNTEYVTEFNQLVFNVLMNACDEEALNIVLRYERSDNGQQ